MNPTQSKRRAMKKKRFSDEKIIGEWREPEAGAKVADLVCKRGILEVTLFSYKAKYGGMDVSYARRLSRCRPMLTGSSRPRFRVKKDAKHFYATSAVLLIAEMHLQFN